MESVNQQRKKNDENVKQHKKNRVDMDKQINSNESDKIINNIKKQQISILNQNNEIEDITFASDEILESVQLEDSTVEIVGFIDEIEGPKIVGKSQHYALLKFIVNNNSRHRVQVVAWNAEVDRIKHHIQPNRILHIDGAKAKKTKTPQFNQGTLPYELIVRSNTIISNLGVFDLKMKIRAVQPQMVNFSEISEHLNSCVLVRGYIKTNFNTFINSFKRIGSGSITDKIYKLEVQIMDYEHDISFEKGQFVEIKGYVKITNDIFYLDVENVSNIKIIGNEKLTFQQLLLGTKPILRKTSCEDNFGLSPNKIARI